MAKFEIMGRKLNNAELTFKTNLLKMTRLHTAVEVMNAVAFQVIKKKKKN